MRISIEVTGAQAARDKIASLAARMRDLRPAYLRAGVVVLRTAQKRIDAEGPGWPPAVAPPQNKRGKVIGTLLHRTGALYRSLTENAEGNVTQDIPGGIRVGTNLRTPDGKYSIGVLQQYGTGVYNVRGLYPARKHTKSGKPSKMVRGIPSRKFLFIDQPTAQRVVAVFAQRVRGEI